MNQNLKICLGCISIVIALLLLTQRASVHTVEIPFPAGPRHVAYEETLCKLDESRLNALKQVDFENEPVINLEKMFHKFVANPFNTACNVVKRLGGKHWSKECASYPDGQKYVCMDDLLLDLDAGNCLVYSFGILDDWSFEDIMDSFGCTVFAFDPSVDFPEHRGNRITFEKIGVSAVTDEAKKMYSLSDILKRNGHTHSKISYLKFDIEGHEKTGLPAWYASGALENVQQLGFEFHLQGGPEDAAAMFKTVRDLTLNEDYRLIVHDVNGVYAKCYNKKASPYFTLAEVVLKKIKKNKMCH